MQISAIVAISENGVIGFENRLPWHLPADLRYFKKLTNSHTIIMGRKTYESIGKPLPNRQNIVISRQINYVAEGCHVVSSVEEAIKVAKTLTMEQIFFIGGAEIYKLALPLCTHLYVTYVHTTVNGDAFLAIDKTIWKELNREYLKADDKNIFDMEFVCYEKLS
jgi:dihydrofolate reductase